MKKYVTVLAMFITSLAANAQNKSDRQPYLTKSFSGENINSVVAKTSGGNITVSGVDPAESHVEVFVWQNGNRFNQPSKDELATKIAEDYNLDISVVNGKLTVAATPKHKNFNWKKTLSFSFKIYVPENVSTNLVTSGGNIVLTGISGDQDFTTSGGNLELNSLSGKIKGSTSGGNISIQNCRNNLDLSTSGGNILAKNSDGNIHVSTSGGSVNLNNLKGNINASTSGGNVKGETIEGELTARTSGGNVSLQKLSCSVKASTSGGDIDVTVLHPAKYISLNNSAGKVNLTLPKNTGMNLNLNAMKISTQNLQNFNGSNSKEEINGTVNGGGIPVTVDAGSGKINVVFE